MAKIGVVILADTETHGDLGRLSNALETAKESIESNDEVKIIFEGAGTKWPVELEDENHKVHALYQAIKEHITGVCAFCARAFQVKDQVQDLGISLLDEYENHPSLRSLVSEGFEVLTY